MNKKKMNNKKKPELSYLLSQKFSLFINNRQKQENSHIYRRNP